MYKITLRHINLNNVAIEIQQCVACILLSYICYCEQLPHYYCFVNLLPAKMRS